MDADATQFYTALSRHCCVTFYLAALMLVAQAIWHRRANVGRENGGALEPGGTAALA
jgi:hypothetical protein